MAPENTQNSTSTQATNVVQPQTQVTFISEGSNIPPFTGTGPESVQSFLRRVQDECVRRNAQTSVEKLAILKSRVSFEPHSLAGKLLKSDLFLELHTYDEFVAELHNHFRGHSLLGVTHSFLKIAQTMAHLTRSTHDVYQAVNVATSLSLELMDQLQKFDWFDADEKLSKTHLQRMMTYLMFIFQLDNQTFDVASSIDFDKNDHVYRVCKKIEDKAPPCPQKIHVVRSEQNESVSSHIHPPTAPVAHSERHESVSIPSPSRGRSPARQNRPYRPRSISRHSRDRSRITCYRCGLAGHVANVCRVVLDESGNTRFDPDQFCIVHNLHGHSIENCRLHKQRLAQASCGTQSGNAARPYQTSPR